MTAKQKVAAVAWRAALALVGLPALWLVADCWLQRRFMPLGYAMEQAVVWWWVGGR